MTINYENKCDYLKIYFNFIISILINYYNININTYYLLFYEMYSINQKRKLSKTDLDKTNKNLIQKSNLICIYFSVKLIIN